MKIVCNCGNETVIEETTSKKKGKLGTYAFIDESKFSMMPYEANWEGMGAAVRIECHKCGKQVLVSL